jgi:hypothetical protein
MIQLQIVLFAVAAQTDRLRCQIVMALDKAHRSMFRTHDNGMGDGRVAGHFKTGQF